MLVNAKFSITFPLSDLLFISITFVFGFENTILAKFIRNVESRIYANLSKQLVDNMFGTTCDSSTTTCPTSGTANVEGATIYWVKDTSTEIITLTITDTDGTTTTMTVPLGDFKF